MKRKQTILRSAAIGLLTIGMITSLVKCEETEITPQDPLPSPSSSVSVSAPDDDDTTDTPTEETPATVQIDSIKGGIKPWLPGEGEGSAANMVSGAKIGVTGGSSVAIVPYELTAAGDTFIPAGSNPISVTSGTQLTAYYPYDSNATSASGSVPVKAGNTDYLWAQANVSDDGTVTFNFEHVMSKVTISFVIDSSLSEAQINSAVSNGNLNLTTGDVSWSSEQQSVSGSLDKNTATFYLPPQVFSEGGFWGNIVLSGDDSSTTAVWQVSEAVTFEAGHSYTFDVIPTIVS